MNKFRWTSLLLLFFFLISVRVNAVDQKSLAKQQQLTQLINNEINTIQKLKKIGPRLRYRLLQLYSEKIRLIRSYENEKFIAAPINERNKKGRNHYFKKSTALYITTKKYGLDTIKIFPNFQQKADIYYTLALNSREFSEDNMGEIYLQKTLQNAPPSSPIVHDAKTSLAEHYYNDKKYHKAISYYKDVIMNEADEWLSKHYYNMSWCYLKINDYQMAVQQVLKSFHLSKMKQYVNVELDVFNSATVIFVFSDEIPRGVNFLLQNANLPAEYLIKMASRAITRKGYELANLIYIKGFSHAKKKNQIDEQTMYLLAMLDFYRSEKKEDEYFRTAKQLYSLNKKGKLDEGSKDIAIGKIKENVGYLQVVLTKNFNISNRDFSASKMKRVMQYFDILQSLDPKNKMHYRFLQGETYFATGEFNKAFHKYASSLELLKKKFFSQISEKKNSKKKMVSRKKAAAENNPPVAKYTPSPEELTLQKKLLDSLLSTIDQGNFDAKINEKYTIYTFSNHLALLPSDSKSQIIYQKLFAIRLKNNDVTEATGILEQYIKYFPADRSKQQAIFSEIFDRFVNEKQTKMVTDWVIKLQTGYLHFDKVYIEKATVILAGLLFSEIEKLEGQGKKEEAIAGYQKLFLNKRYPHKIKARSSMNIAGLYLSLDRTLESYQWLQKSFQFYSEKDRLENLDRYVRAADEYALRQDFNRASAISTGLFGHYCQSNYSQKNSFFKHMIYFQMLENNNQAVFKNLKRGVDCKVEPNVFDKVLTDVISHYDRHRNFELLQKFETEFGHIPATISPLARAYVSFFFYFHDIKDLKNAEESYSILQRKYAREIPSSVHKFKQNMYETNNFLDNHKNLSFSFSQQKKFEQEIFEKELESNFSKMAVYTQSAEILIRKSLPQNALRLFDHLIVYYDQFSKNLNDFTPSSMPKEFVESFKGQMVKLAQDLKLKSLGYQDAAKSAIAKDSPLVKENAIFLPSGKTIVGLDFRYPAYKLFSTMDRFENSRLPTSQREAKK